MNRKETVNNRTPVGKSTIILLMLFCTGFAVLGDAAAQGRDPRGSFTKVGFSLVGGPMQGFGDYSTTQGDLALHLNMININNFKYTGFGVEASYKWDESLALFSVMGRMEVGLKKGHPTGGHVVGFNTLYVAFMAGYATGTVWDTAYIDLYDAFDEVAVAVSGVPLYASLGWRRIGRLGLNVEAIAGVTLITSSEADLPQAAAPSVIPGIGARIGFGFDSFFYTR